MKKFDSMLQIIKKVLFYFILFLFMYLVAETFSFIFYFIVEGKLFSFSQYQSSRLAILINSTASKEAPEVGILELGEGIFSTLHPYLGFVLDPRNFSYISEYGFYGKSSPVSSKDDNKVIIGIFGGSFATGTSKIGGVALIDELTKSSIFDGKEIVIHTLALGGYKQPQQLLALTYLLSLGAHFDIVINLDGFNEVALPPVENIPKQVFPFYPRAWFRRVYNFNDTNTLVMLGEIALLAERQKTWATVFATAPLRYSIVSNCLWKYYDNRLSHRKFEKEIAFQQYKLKRERDVGYGVTGPPFHYDNESDLYEALAQVWKEGSIQMHKLAIANEIAYFHFLQPNQYIAGSKIMKPEESKLAIRDNHPYKTGVEKGYPHLRRAGEDLINRGINFQDLTMIFVCNDAPLYRDACCHLNEAGYRIIGSTIGKTIVEYYRRSQDLTKHNED